ncbi:hypothetical protein FOL47_002020 [Perkinsus chesapeaki]|uniref:RING-type domain-containing protein n=1 Tax=Perkinsus chesapeaki TaxID=330153 RepID=A0A7J6MHN4_PERCH|nr:hypothetical protein FOL47_002020 [Perkinsus chesapeaki]
MSVPLLRTRSSRWIVAATLLICIIGSLLAFIVAYLPSRVSRIILVTFTLIVPQLFLALSSFWRSYRSIDPLGSDCMDEHIISTTVISLSDQKITLNPTCAICLADFELNGGVAELPCGHLFHSQCFDAYIDKLTPEGRYHQCPVCRYELGPRL